MTFGSVIWWGFFSLLWMGVLGGRDARYPNGYWVIDGAQAPSHCTPSFGVVYCLGYGESISAHSFYMGLSLVIGITFRVNGALAVC